MKYWQRGAIVIGLLALLFGMGIHYGAVEADRWPYPHEDTLAADPGAHVGQRCCYLER